MHDGAGSRTAATSKMERFVIIVNGWKPLTIITKRSILYVAAVLDPTLINVEICYTNEESIRGTSNLSDKTIYSIVVCKIDIFFVLLKEVTK